VEKSTHVDPESDEEGGQVLTQFPWYKYPELQDVQT